LKTAILGAGVSGLSLARFLIEGGVPAEELHLFEASHEVGGLCRSKTVDGFTYDQAGGHILYSKDAAARDWMVGCTGGGSAFHETQRETRIRFDDCWVHYPFENGLCDLPPQVNYECVTGYVTAWEERLRTGSTAPDDFDSWVRWRFGAGIHEHFMRPYNEKIWKRALTELGSSWVAGRVPEAPIEDVLKASVGIRTEGYAHQSVFQYPLKGGFQAITDGIASTLSERVRLNTRVTQLTRHGEGWRVDGEDFDLVISTLPMTELPRLIEGIPPEVSAAMSGLIFNSLSSILLAIDHDEQPDFSWIYLPHDEQGPANRVTYISNYSPHNAPSGRSGLQCEVNWRGEEPAPGEELTGEVTAGLERAGIVKPGQVLFSDRTDVRHAYIVYTHGFKERRQRAIDWLEAEGILPLGRFGRFDYFNSDQCVIAARELAASLLERRRTGDQAG
jgi:protoporphyrinogen oxidase